MQRLLRIINVLISSIGNLFSRADIYLITEDHGWVISEEACFIAKKLEEEYLVRVSVSPYLIKNSIVHFLSFNTLTGKKGPKKINPSNRIILSWLHLAPNDERTQYIHAINNTCHTIHTICQKTKTNLTNAGLPSSKVQVIHQGLDLNLFTPSGDKMRIREHLNLPKDKFIIGSFQKDGNGWGEGLIPKLIKGPDILVDSLKKASSQLDFHVLLTGPARGYVKKGLEEANISYTHVFLDNYSDIVDYYHAIDLYVCASRVEGGPKAILESWATKTPIICTEVGMALDLIKNGENGVTCPIERSDIIAESLIKVANQPNWQKSMTAKAYKEVFDYSWEKIVARYKSELYEL